MVKINMISVKKLIEYISMESIIKKRIVIRLDENKSLTEIPEGIVEQKCFYKINYYLFLFIALSSKRKNKIIIDIKQIIMSNLEIVFTLCIPILLVGLGMGMKTKTPKKNRWIGWRTPAAMKNETIFKKANIYAGKIMFRYGFVILILTSIIDIILRYESIGSFITPWVCMAQIIMCVLMIRKIERKIRKF